MRFLLYPVVLSLAAGLVGCRPAEPEVQAPAPAPPVAAVALDDTSRYSFDRVMAYARAERLHERPLGEAMQALGERFLGAPYVAGLLDAPSEETLLAPTDRFDCVLFVETALALARGVQAEDYAYGTFLRRIEDQRYRGGHLDGYCSRLHYFSEWIADNEARGTVENITRALGGEPLDKELTFMSAHRGSYPRFATNDSLFAGIQAMERDLAGLDLYYIPQDRLRAVYDELQAGDIVALATHLEGLDVTHTGLVYKGADGGTGLLHASTAGSVTIAPDLQAYVEGNKVQIGAIIARPVAHR